MMKLASGPSRNAATERPRPWWRPVEPATLRSSFETPVRHDPVVVTGATGRVGRHVIDRLF